MVWKIWTKIYCSARNLLVHHSSLSHTTYVETKKGATTGNFSDSVSALTNMRLKYLLNWKFNWILFYYGSQFAERLCFTGVCLSTRGRCTPPSRQTHPPWTDLPLHFRDGHCSGWYAFYWNAFIFKKYTHNKHFSWGSTWLRWTRNVSFNTE